MTTQQIFEAFNTLNIAVVGDVMLDSYIHGNVDRISPEAPVPILNITEQTHRLGGAANVALNCKAMGAQVHLFSVTGTDAAHHQIIQLLQEQDIHTQGILQSQSRPTTIKTRILAKQHQMLRLDTESTEPLSTPDEHNLINTLLLFIQKSKPHILIFEDYDKGVLKPNIIQKVIAHCHEVGTIIAVDPKKRNFFEYKGVHLFKPNLKEVQDALNLETINPQLSSLQAIHTALTQKLGHQISLITLSEKGIFYAHQNTSQIQPTKVRQVADVSGAGDTVIALSSMVYALTKDPALMAHIGNTAGGLVCEKPGVVALNKTELLQALLNQQIQE